MEMETTSSNSAFGFGLLHAKNMNVLSEWSTNRSATCKAAENDCLERRNSIRPRVSSRVAYKAERGGNELFWSPWKMYPRSQERHRNREATVYLPAVRSSEKSPLRSLTGRGNLLSDNRQSEHNGIDLILRPLS